MEWKSLSGFQSLLDTLKIKTEQYIIVLFPFLGLLEEVKWISLGDAFQFLQCFILLKNQVLISDNGYDHFSSLLNSFFSQFITQGTILGIIQKWKNEKKKNASSNVASWLCEQGVYSIHDMLWSDCILIMHHNCVLSVFLYF